MALFINEKKMVEDSIFQFEEKLSSATARFIDSTPTFVTYYHVNADETTTDEGFMDVASIIGFRSPIKFKKIVDFPLYGIEQLLPQLQDGDQGLDTEFSSEAIILPNTIKPLENDYFTIPYLHDTYLFRVTEITYDNARPDNFYKINYQLEYIDNEKLQCIEKQATETYSCILENIGTENKCIIQSDYMEKIQKIDEMYDDIASTYMTIFYDDKHNCLLGDLGMGNRIYDPFQTQFVNKHSLLNKKGNLKTTILTDEFSDIKRRLKYERSIYRFIERKDITLVNNFRYSYYNGTMERESSFYRWQDSSIKILDMTDLETDVSTNLLSDEFVLSIRTNGFVESEYAKLIQAFVRGENLTINDIPLDLNDELIQLNASLEVFFFTPIVMYIIKEIVNDEIKQKK